MKPGTLLTPTQTLPDRLQKAIQANFPNQELQNLDIRYYEDVANVGYEFYTNQVLPTCNPNQAAHYLAPFISFVRLGEALILDWEDGIVVYETDENDCCTETGPFWFVRPKL